MCIAKSNAAGKFLPRDKSLLNNDTQQLSDILLMYPVAIED